MKPNRINTLRWRRESLQVEGWAQADAALAELGRLDRELAAIEARRARAQARAEQAARRSARRSEARRAGLAAALERFCRRHRAELGRVNGHQRRSRRLLFGRLGYRSSQAVTIGDEGAALRALAHWPGGQRFLRVRTEMDRETLREFLLEKRPTAAGRAAVERRLRRAGIALEKRESWFYEVNARALKSWG